MISEVSFTVQGKERGFKLGTYSARLMEEKSGLKLSDFLTKMSGTYEEVEEDGKKTMVEIVRPDLKAQSTFFFCCALHYTKSKKATVDFEEFDVDDWRDELGTDRVSEISTDLFNQYSPKNLNPPMTGGATA